MSATDGGDGGSEQAERPKLVALPEPTAEPAPADDAEPAPADVATEPEPETAVAPTVDAAADRLALERSLSGPRTPGPRIVGAPSGASATDPAAPSYAPWAPQPHGVADAIALTATPELLQALRAELAMRAHAEAGLRARVVDAETRLAARMLLSQRTAEALGQVRAELGQLAGLLHDERTRRQAAERRVAELEQRLRHDRDRSDDTAVEIAALRDSLAQLREPTKGHGDSAPGGESHGDASPSAATEVRADRLNEALTRLRAGAEPIDPLPEPAAPVTPAALPMPVAAPATVATEVASPRRQATLAGPFRTLCHRDSALAGQLALSLLRMQRVADPRAVSYDIVLGPGHGCLQVTSDDRGIEVARQATARPLAQVDLHVVGGPDRFAKLLTAGRIRRRLGFGLARVRGNRERLTALDALLALPLDLPALAAGGMSTDPSILFSLVATVVRPSWTHGARFSISHLDGNAPPTYLLIADGRRLEVTSVAPTGPITTVISCAQSELPSALAGSPALESGSVQVAGDPASLAQLQSWIKRAQSE